MDLEIPYLDLLLKTLRAHDVAVFKHGELVLQLNPVLPAFSEPVVSPEAMAGGWKRGPDLE